MKILPDNFINANTTADSLFEMYDKLIERLHKGEQLERGERTHLHNRFQGELRELVRSTAMDISNSIGNMRITR